MAKKKSTRPGRAKYTFSNIPNDPVAKAQIYALSDLLTPTSSEALFDRSATAKAMYALHSQWRKRLAELRKENWAKLRGPGYMNHYNCPPPFGYTKESVRPCRDYLACPFCWCRYVVRDTFDRVAWALYGTTDLIRMSAGDDSEDSVNPIHLDVLDLTHRGYAEKSESLVTIAGKCQTSLSTTKDVLGDNSPGSYVLTTFEPDDGRWRVTRRALALTYPDFSYDESTDQPNVRAKVTKFGVSPKDLAGIVGRVCHYPAALLTGDVSDVVNILNVRSGPRGRTPRLSAFYGTLRNSSERKRSKLLQEQAGTNDEAE